METIVKNTETLMVKTIESLKKDLMGINTGRANPALLDGVKVESYGSLTPLNRVANISASDATTLLVQVYDKSLIHSVEKAIQLADLGMTPQTDGSLIRLNIPKLTEERRKELAKLVKKYGDDRKVSIRNIRKDGNEEAKKLKGTISEDQIKKAENDIQKLTDKYNAEIDKLVDEKSKSLLTI